MYLFGCMGIGASASIHSFIHSFIIPFAHARGQRYQRYCPSTPLPTHSAPH